MDNSNIGSKATINGVTTGADRRKGSGDLLFNNKDEVVVLPADILRAVAGNKWKILGIVAIFVVLVYMAVGKVTPVYQSETLLLIDGSNSTIPGLSSIVAGLSADSSTVIGQIEVIKSKNLIKKLISKLELNQYEEFNPLLRKKSGLSSFLGNSFDHPAANSDLSIEEREFIVVYDEIIGNLSLSAIEGSQVISLRFSSQSPKLAASVANTLSALYIAEQLEVKFETTQQITAWLNERVTGLRKKVERSEVDVEKFRSRKGLIRGKTGTLYSEDISGLNTELVRAKTEFAGKRARYEQIKSLVNSFDGVESATEVLDSLLIQKLREQEAELDGKLAELSMEYGDQHPKMINLRAEREDLQLNIENEVNKIVRGMENELKISAAHVEALNKSLDSLKGVVAKSNRDTVQLRALEREAQANRMLLETFLARFKESSSQEDYDIQQPDARIISTATVALEPFFPKTGPILVLAVVGSLLISILVVIIRKLLDKKYQNITQIESDTGLHVFDTIPYEKLKSSDMPVDFLQKPGSPLGESLKSLAAGVRHFNHANPPKSVMVTSSLPGEGKSFVALGIGQSLALTGLRVVVLCTDDHGAIPTNSRRDRSIEKKKGLTEFLNNEVKLSDVIYKDEGTGLYVIPPGDYQPRLSSLYESERMLVTIDSLKEQFDLVIIDVPSVLTSSLSKILSHKADVVLYLVDPVENTPEAVRYGIRQINKPLANVVLALAKVNAKQHPEFVVSASIFDNKSLRRLKKNHSSELVSSIIDD